MRLPGELSFGPFQFEPGTGRLTKQGHRIKLQPKAAALLCALLECPGEIVSHASLQKCLWPDGTHVDFELGIKAVVRRLREALGDSPSEPVYIQSLYGEGYRFIAPVTPVGRTGTVPEPVPEHPDRSAPSVRPTILWTAALTAITSILAFVIVGAMPHNFFHFHNRDWVIVSRFENRTGQAMLDGSVEYALARELSQSRYVNIASQDRISDALQLMRQNPDVPLTAELARQVALRDNGIRLVLTGRIEEFGGKYLLSVDVVEPTGGTTVAVIERSAEGNQLLEAVQSLAVDVRRKLGETILATAPQAPHLEQATTPSLAALRTFSVAMQSVNQRKWDAAVQLLEEAVLADPDFALAHIYAAHCYANLGMPQRAAPHFEAAYRLSPGVRDRERLFILGSYYERFVMDYGRAVEVYQALLKLYPDDYWGINNLAGIYGLTRRYEEWVSMVERRSALRPNGPPGDLMNLYLYYRYGRRDPVKASRFREEILRRGSPSLKAAVHTYAALEEASYRWLNGDIHGAAEELNAVGTHREGADEFFQINLALANLTMGRLRSAAGICQQIRARGSRNECLLRVAFIKGDFDAAKALLHEMASNDPPPANSGAEAAIASWLGEDDLARSRGGMPQLVSGILLTVHQHPREAIEAFKRFTGIEFYGSLWFHQFMWLGTARALEQQGELEKAIAELKDNSQPRRVDLSAGYSWLPCRIELAKLYRKAGKPAEAAHVEDEIRTWLSAGDADFHPLAGAQM